MWWSQRPGGSVLSRVFEHHPEILRELVALMERRAEPPPVPDTPLRQENERLLSLLRAHPPPRPTMLPNRRLKLAACQSWRCAACGALLNECFHADHIVPWSDTFNDSDANISIKCVPCHTAKTSAEQSVRRRSVAAPVADDGACGEVE